MATCDSIPKYWRLAAKASGWVARHLSSLAALFLLFTVAATATEPIAFADSTVGSFEIDGNLIVDHTVPPAEPIDWLSSPFPASLITFTDATGQGDDIFGQGSKENDQSTWVCTTGSAPQKDDIVNQLLVPQSTTPVAG